MLSAVEIAKTLNIRYEGKNYEYTGITTDSRNMEPGQIFLALQGEKFDGHNFLRDVVTAGVKAVIISKDVDLPSDVVKFVVPNTLYAYQKLASAHRLSNKQVHVIAITGSNGKTSSKDILAHVLAAKYKVVKTQANFNNEIGIAKTLFDIRDDTEIAVVEIGMRGLGQIADLCNIVYPESGVVSNVGETHIEILGSKENIAKAKGELVERLNSSGFAVLNGDNEYTRAMSSKTNAQVFYFGLNKENDYYATDIKMRSTGTDFVCVEKVSGKKINVHMPILGIHNVYNALSAMAMAVCYGMDIAESARALENVVLTQRRLEIIESQGVTFIDDSYNASPASMNVALETLQLVRQSAEPEKQARSIAVLADMLELGEIAESAHRQIGKQCGDTKVDFVFCYGNSAKYIYEEAKKCGVQAQLCENVRHAYQCLDHVLRPGDIVLLKGSHSMEVHKVLEYFG
ncbi:MAG: UDP-N-acetylmuramoyl-tripeptide--D-alanyl-D-alanine ligase [Acidaminococcaceae bacterium]|nr:UDP-N-acetylmuramoyl-tripeptide--D-alanyl-D-alanine ligase [Acidaminococcaceae bacterium]